MKLPILCQVFNEQVAIPDLTLNQWDLLLRQARSAMLLAKLYYLVESKQLLDDIPATAFRYLKSAKIHSDKQLHDLFWEVRHLKKIARKLKYPLVLLKGAAYTMSDKKAARGRIFSDIDLLVAHENIANTESQLMLNGWVSSKLDEYDQTYYRQWMHEIPAMRHMFRGSVIDLHHNILPKIVKNCPNATLLLTEVKLLAEHEGLSVLSSIDMIIHSATHLFYDGELEHGCRDIIDLFDLLNQFVDDGGTLDDLVARANELGLQNPVYYALHYVGLILQFSVPEETINKLQGNVPKGLMVYIMDFLFMRALMPDHESCNDSWSGLARWLLYVRSHWLRMPLYQLIPHLLRKSYKRVKGEEVH